ncbi:MAG: hypothetical protein QOI31_1943 [Solirubrobacterales bacterium]|nr:hypothetical protein [Solirubrobacterales bacterium]
MRKIILIVLTVGVLGGGSAIVAAQVSDDEPAGSSATQPTTTNEDVSGPCDEAEHANDPRCLPGGEDRGDNGGGADDQSGRDHPEDNGVADPNDIDEDISGPCDEAEHANDPECTGVTGGVPSDDDAFDDNGGDVDSSGPGSGGDDDSSGPGGGGDDSSGPGGGDDDSSGSGSGGDDDSSGSGSDDDD